MQQTPNIALVPIGHDLDVTTVPATRAVIDRCIDDGCRRIILNMSGASYVDSAGMGLLLAEIRRMRGLGGLLSLTNVSEQVLAIFRRARLVDFAPVSACENDQRALVDPGGPPLWRTVVPIDARDLSGTRRRIERLLEQTMLTSDEIFDAKLAVGEAMGNAVDHANPSGASVTLTGYDDRVVMEVSDCGEGFDPLKVKTHKPDTYAERGRGLQLMELLSDSVSIVPRSCGQGMLVRLVKLAHAGTD